MKSVPRQVIALGLMLIGGCSLERTPEAKTTTGASAPVTTAPNPSGVAGPGAGPGASLPGNVTGTAGRSNDPSDPAVIGTDQLDPVPPSPPSSNGPSALLEDGSVCNSNAECSSNHCNNAICCSSGQCCQQESDCGASAQAPICSDPAHCQGQRGVATCESNRCVVQAPSADDDSACTSDVIASECGPYHAVRCTGALEQGDPVCANRCESDVDCDTEAHCSDQGCVADRANGKACAENRECLSGHCADEVCCDLGNCCNEQTPCPQNPTTCDTPAECQGSRPGFVCDERFNCVDGPVVDDDSACDDQTLALSCDGLKDVMCTGAEVQPPPACGARCNNDSDCDADHYCYFGSCRPDEPNGGICALDRHCASGRCRNFICCEAGDCCTLDLTCQQLGTSAPVCDRPETCEGHLETAFCSLTRYSCESLVFETSAGCASEVIDDCSPYAPGLLRCEDVTGGTARPRCPASCRDDSDCLDPNICIDERCRLECTNDAACGADQICARNRCVNACQGNGNCPDNLICREGVCQPECINSDECPGQQVCRNNRCVQREEDENR